MCLPGCFWDCGLYNNYFAGIGSTSALAQQAESGVAWWAHIGGFVFGVAVAWIYKNKRGLNPVIHRDEDRNYL
jgi:membrane associated rhomboid family serine protease